MNTVEITIQNGTLEVFHGLINVQEKYCLINESKREFSDEFLDNLIRTIRLWNNEYGNSIRIDDEEFTVIVNENEKFHGKGIFPDNYDTFKKLLGELND